MDLSRDAAELSFLKAGVEALQVLRAKLAKPNLLQGGPNVPLQAAT